MNFFTFNYFHVNEDWKERYRDRQKDAHTHTHKGGGGGGIVAQCMLPVKILDFFLNTGLSNYSV